MADDRTVADVGEFGLIEAIRRHLPPPPPGEIWSGDDAAVLSSSNERLVLMTDAIVQGIDFDPAYSPPETIGAKAVAINASDIAAMGGRPRYLVATLIVPGDTSLGFVEAIAEGLAQASNRLGINAVGGDISDGRDLVLSIAMTGDLADRAVTRSGARSGDTIMVTGSLGAAAAGLLLLKKELSTNGVDASVIERLVERQQRPTPRVAEGPALAELGATAMIDISDGLLADLTHILDASDAECDLDPESIPIDPDLVQLNEKLAAQNIDPLQLALTGGEDYELLFTLPPDRQEAAASSLPDFGSRVTRIGIVVESERSVGDRSLESWSEKGWEHLRQR